MAKVHKLKLVKNEKLIGQEAISSVSNMVKDMRKGEIQGFLMVAKYRDGGVRHSYSAGYESRAEIICGASESLNRLLSDWRGE